ERLTGCGLTSCPAGRRLAASTQVAASTRPAYQAPRARPLLFPIAEDGMANFHVLTNADATVEMPEIRRIGIDDLTDVLRAGWRDFWRRPSHLAFLGLIYPLMGVAIALWSSGQNAWPLLFPLIS